VVTLTLSGSRIGRRPAAWLGTAFAFASFAGALVTFASLIGKADSDRHFAYSLYTWAGSASLEVPFSVWVDPLSVTEMLIVSGVGALIVLYSVGYMHGDVKERRFFE